MSRRHGDEPAKDAKLDLLDHFAREHSPFVDIGQQLGAEALDLVLGLLGPGQIIIPTRRNFWRRLERDLRDERIRAEFNGRNHAELAETYGVTPRQVRNILARSKRETKKATRRLQSAMGSVP